MLMLYPPHQTEILAYEGRLVPRFGHVRLRVDVPVFIVDFFYSGLVKGLCETGAVFVADTIDGAILRRHSGF